MKLLWGAKAVMLYLRQKWGWNICRQHLWRLSTRRTDKFPLTMRLRARRSYLVASPVKIDAWMKRNCDVRTIAAADMPKDPSEET